MNQLPSPSRSFSGVATSRFRVSLPLLLVFMVLLLPAPELARAHGDRDTKRQESCSEHRDRSGRCGHHAGKDGAEHGKRGDHPHGGCDHGGGSPGGCRGRGVPGGWIEDHAERLGLNAATTAAIRAIVEESRRENDRLEREASEASRSLRALLDTDLPDTASVMAAVDRLGGIETQMKRNRFGAMLKIRALMTPAQRAALMGMRAEWGKGHPEH